MTSEARCAVAEGAAMNASRQTSAVKASSSFMTVSFQETQRRRYGPLQSDAQKRARPMTIVGVTIVGAAVVDAVISVPPVMPVVAPAAGDHQIRVLGVRGRRQRDDRAQAEQRAQRGKEFHGDLLHVVYRVMNHGVVYTAMHDAHPVAQPMYTVAHNADSMMRRTGGCRLDGQDGCCREYRKQPDEWLHVVLLSMVLRRRIRLEEWLRADGAMVPRPLRAGRHLRSNPVRLRAG